MKRMIILMIGFLLIGFNYPAEAGDLIVEGKVGIGTPTPVANLDVRGSAIFNEDSGDYDFRIEGDTDPNLFSIDAGNDVIGIGTTPVAGQKVRIRNTAGNAMWLDSSATATTDTNEYGLLSYFRLLGSGTLGSNIQKIANSYTLRIQPASAGYSGSGRLGAFQVAIDGVSGGSSTFNDVSALSIQHWWTNSATPFFNATNYGGVIIGDIAGSGAWGLGTISNAFGIKVDKQTYGTNKMGIWLNGDGAGADIVFGPNQETRIYSSAGELFAKDGAGNVTQISPHDYETGEWIFYSKNMKTGKVVRVDMERLVKAVEKLTGEKFMIETVEDAE